MPINISIAPIPPKVLLDSKVTILTSSSCHINWDKSFFMQVDTK
jgi:hypothetical protein